MCDALIYVLAEGAPHEQLAKLRKQIEVAGWKVKPPDRESWGRTPDQQAAAKRLMGLKP